MILFVIMDTTYVCMYVCTVYSLYTDVICDLI